MKDQATRDREAIHQASINYVDDWAKKQPYGLLNHTTKVMSDDFSKGAEWGIAYARQIQSDEVRELCEALRFYASKSLHQDQAWVFRAKFLFDLVNETDLEELSEPVGNKGKKYVIGGRRAREALAKFEAANKEKI